MGVAHNSAFCLGLYSFLMVLLLLAQASLAIAFFADNSWKKKLPHDDTGEAKQVQPPSRVPGGLSLQSVVLDAFPSGSALKQTLLNLLGHGGSDPAAEWIFSSVGAVSAVEGVTLMEGHKSRSQKTANKQIKICAMVY